MTSKQRAYLKSLAMTMDPIFQFGKNSLTPENTKAIAEALEARELIKINVLQNCADDPKEIAQIVAERTHSQVVQVIGKKIVLYKELNEFCNEHYKLKIENGYVRIYEVDEQKNEKLLKSTDISSEYLTTEDLEKLKNGIEIYTKKELNKTIEDFE